MRRPEPLSNPKRREFAWGGVFEDSVGYACKNGIWEQVWPTKLWLYRDGDECSEVTGGWEIRQQTAEIRGTTLSVYCNINDGTYRGTIFARNQIDLTPYRTIHFTKDITSGSRLLLLRGNTISDMYNNYVKLLVEDASDISGVTGLCYICVSCIGDPLGWKNINKIWLEP